MLAYDEVLLPSEVEIARRALQAAVEGSFSPDWEFETLIGVSRETVQKVYAAWPYQIVGKEELSCAVIGSMKKLMLYPHGKEE